MATPRRDRGSIVLGWLTKLVVVLSFIGVVGFDTVSITACHLNGTDDANTAAEAAASAWQTSHGQIQAAYDAAEQTVVGNDEVILASTFTIDSAGNVSLQLRRTATTLLTQHIGPLKHLIVVTVTGSASPPTP
jgi:Tfp pilus assembly protein PilX